MHNCYLWPICFLLNFNFNKCKYVLSCCFIVERIIMFVSVEIFTTSACIVYNCLNGGHQFLNVQQSKLLCLLKCSGPNVDKHPIILSLWLPSKNTNYFFEQCLSRFEWVDSYNFSPVFIESPFSYRFSVFLLQVQYLGQEFWSSLPRILLAQRSFFHALLTLLLKIYWRKINRILHIPNNLNKEYYKSLIHLSTVILSWEPFLRRLPTE